MNIYNIRGCECDNDDYHFKLENWYERRVFILCAKCPLQYKLNRLERRLYSKIIHDYVDGRAYIGCLLCTYSL